MRLKMFFDDLSMVMVGNAGTFSVEEKLGSSQNRPHTLFTSISLRGNT